MAPSVPRIVLIKNSSKPLVVACVRMKRPTPSTVHERLISMARFFAVRKRTAMWRLGDIKVSRAKFARERYELLDRFRLHTIPALEAIEILGHHTLPQVDTRLNPC